MQLMIGGLVNLGVLRRNGLGAMEVCWVIVVFLFAYYASV